MVRTKIKGKSNTAASNEDVRVPNFDDLPPLPVSDRRPTAILDEMEHAILTMPIASGAGAGAIASPIAVQRCVLCRLLSLTTSQVIPIPIIK